MQKNLYYKLSGLVLAGLFLVSCANKPNVIKEYRDCVKVKGKGGSIYFCMEVKGGDAKVK